MEEKSTHAHVITNPQVLFSWESPARAYKRKSGGVLRFYFALALLLSVIVALFYALTITPPGDVEYKLTRFGIETNGVAYRYENLLGFYIVKRFDYFVVTIQSNSPFFNHVYLVVDGQKTLQKVVDILSDKIVFIEKPQKTFTDRFASVLSSVLPDEETTPEPQEKHEVEKELSL